MSCPSIEKLSALLDGDLAPAESAALRAHGAGCPRCSEALTELAAMVATSHELDQPEPPPTLWRAVEGALEERDRPAPLSGWLTWRPFAVGALAGAVVVAAAVFGLPAVRGRLASGPVAAPPGPATVAVASDPLLDDAEAEFAQAAAAYERSIEKLRTLLVRAQTRWSPDQRVRYAERLTRLDEAIARSRDLVHRTPADSAGNEQLFAAYQQKIAFLAEAVHRGGEWSERTP